MSANDGDWVLALVAGKWFVGRLQIPPLASLEISRLDPAYEWEWKLQPNAKNPNVLEIEYAALPIAGMLSFGSLWVPNGSVVKPVTELSGLDRARAMATVREAQGIIQQLSLTQGGILSAASVPQGRQ